MTPVLTGNSFLLCFLFILLVPFAIAGLALVNTGLGRSRSAAHTITSSVCLISVAALVYFFFGFAVQGYFGLSAHWIDVGSKSFDWIGGDAWFLRGVALDGSAPSLAFLLGIFSVALASLIALGAGAERWRLAASIISTALFAGWIYPLFAHWAWTGWLANIGGFIDTGGSGVIHVTGGVTALSLVWLLGPRRGKYAANGMPAAIPAHNGVFVLFGCMLAWVGWLGLNSAGTILYAGLPAESSILTIVNTTLGAASAALTSAAVTRIRFRKPDASLIANGWMAGLVAGSAGCATVKPAMAILIGLVAGALVVISVEFLEFTLKVDDPCGSVSVHAVAGIWGLLAAGMVGSAGHFMSQLIGVATLLGFVFPMTYGLNWILGLLIPHRVSLDGERQGLDLHELGADAYPEFVVHADEFMQR
jgi:Amt family ammonium transporter